MGLFVSRYALVSQKALVSRVVHQNTAFLARRAIRGCLGHGYFVFSSALAFVRSGEPFNEFGHARNMSSRWPVFQCGNLVMFNSSQPPDIVNAVSYAGKVPIVRQLEEKRALTEATLSFFERRPFFLIAT
jgi:hypothetical protein